MRHLLTVVALLLSSVCAGAAPPAVQLAIRDGMVWLVARDATLGQVFDEWARVGQTQIVNGDRLTGRLSVELNGIPEGQALDFLLRAGGGFVATQRPPIGAPAAPGQSVFARIVIVAGTAAVARTASAAQPVSAAAPLYQPPPAATQIAPGVQRIVGADGQPVPDDQEDAAGPPAPTGRRGLPPGFAEPTQAPPVTPATPPQSGPVGSPVPGMVVPAPATGSTPQPPRRPSGTTPK